MTTLAFSCLHAPYHHVGAMDFLADLRKRYKPTDVVCLGDEADLYRLSRHDQDPDAMSVTDELTQLRQTMSDLGGIFPRLKLCHSNHVRRLFKSIAKAGLPESVLKEWSQILEAPKGWQWAKDWIIQGVHYFHADGYSSGNVAGMKSIHTRRASTVFGHFHTLGRIEYHATGYWEAWSASAGCLITTDVDSPAMRFTKQHDRKAIRGAVIVADGVPHFEPMIGE